MWEIKVTWVRLQQLVTVRLQQLQEQCYPFLSVCVAFPCVQTMVWLTGFGMFNQAHMLMHAITRKDCVNITYALFFPPFFLSCLFTCVHTCFLSISVIKHNEFIHNLQLSFLSILFDMGESNDVLVLPAQAATDQGLRPFGNRQETTTKMYLLGYHGPCPEAYFC